MGNSIYYRSAILKSLEKIEKVPIPMGIYSEINHLINTGAEISKIADLVLKDPTLTIQVLKIANSAAFTPVSGEITRLEIAIVRIGLAQFKSVLMTLGVINTYSNYGKKIDFKKFCKHSFMVSFAATDIYKRIMKNSFSPEDEAKIYLAGLLHDIGILFLTQFCYQHYKLVVEKKGKDDEIVSLLEDERKILGISHDEVGYIVTKRWNFPEFLSDVINQHHNFSLVAGPNARLTKAIIIANELVNNLGFGFTTKSMLSPKVLMDFNVHPEDIIIKETTWETYLEKAEAILELM